MASATLVNIVETYSVPPQIVALWTCPSVAAGDVSPSLVSLELLSRSPFLTPYYSNPQKRLRGVAYAVQLLVFSVSCLSEKYSVRMLNKNDISLLDTVYEVGNWKEINKSLSDVLEHTFTIRNRDDEVTNKLYLYFDNSSGTVETGPISVELTYIVLQDRNF